MNRIILIYGSIAGLVVAGLMMMTMQIGHENKDFAMGEVLGYLGMFIALSMIFLAVHQQRKLNGGVMKFGKAFLIGLGITVIASLFYSTAWEVYLANSEGDFITEYWTEVMEQMKAKGASDQELDAAKEEMAMWSEYYKNPAIRFGMTMMELIPVGIVFSLVAAFIFKRKPKQLV